TSRNEIVSDAGGSGGPVIASHPPPTDIAATATSASLVRNAARRQAAPASCLRGSERRPARRNANAAAPIATYAPTTASDERRGLREQSRNALKHPPERGRHQQNAGHGRERELPAGVLCDPRVDREGDRRREQQRIPPRSHPARTQRNQPGHPHHAGALERWP